MSWSYSSPLNGWKDTVRSLIGDVFSTTPLLSDEEILSLEARYPNAYRAAMAACRRIIAKLSQEADLSIAGELRVNLSDRMKAFRLLMVDLQAELEAGSGSGMPYAGGLSWSEKDASRADTSTPPSHWPRIRSSWGDEEHD